MTKTNSFIPHNFPYFATSQAIQDYILLPENYIQYISTFIKGFICIAHKKAKASIPNEF